ncbi:UDP-N-acetylmuramoyl-tripeptide--D-alanyl-D-alanine ligase [Acetobacteraceae bacterium]|nr:UDP-N-acetylmuramoyl-tripeptide--D-alanyl-D-alanine ligase [Candidatus Parcubacteria bacterium]
MKSFLKKIIVTLLTLEARAVVRKYNPRIVAVTGSVGKTSAKDAIYCVLAHSAYVRKSQKSFNSEVGLPLTILGRPNAWSNPLLWIENLFDGLSLLILPARYPEWLVLEVGADRPGDIRSVSKWLPVDVAVITRLPEIPVHVEFFNTVEDIVEEKASLISALKNEGSLVLYEDDERVRSLTSRASTANIVTFGTSADADVSVSDLKILYEEGKHKHALGMHARLRIGTQVAPIEVLGTLGTHSLLPLLAGAAVGKALGKDLPEILEALKAYTPPQGRMRIIEGIKETTLIDDTYNSSPAAVAAALEALKLTGGRRKIAVMGDMLELGRHSAPEHKKAGVHAAKVADILITIGFRARDMAQGALDEGMKDTNVFQFEDARRAGAELQNMLKEGDVVLIKGSQSIRMERTVEELMAHPEQAKDLLVRQDEEWRKR